ncbi:MAG: energy-coupled thiamine transporter ThiT [Clostridia bacterium]|nr:energy-coupled thiamine transporter ThiT [Clostridia bacterium]
MLEIFRTFVKDGSVNFTDAFKEHWLFFLCWIVGLIVICFCIYLLVRAINRRKNPELAQSSVVHVGKKKLFDTKTLVMGSLCLGLAFILSFIKLWEMPQGGSITLASALPIILFGYIYGWKPGFIVAFTYSILQMIQSPGYVMNIPQALLDYVVAFTILGIAGCFRKNIFVGTILAYVLRFFAHVAAGLIWYQQYNATSFSGTAYCFLYNLVFLLPELCICLVILAVPAVRKLIRQLQMKAKK